MTERRATWTAPGNHEPYSFETGRHGRHADARQYVYSKSRRGYLEALAAARDWRRSQWDHAETSFYGAERIRAMRHFWIGVAWGIRERGGDPPAAPTLTQAMARAELAQARHRGYRTPEERYG